MAASPARKWRQWSQPFTTWWVLRTRSLGSCPTKRPKTTWKEYSRYVSTRINRKLSFVRVSKRALFTLSPLRLMLVFGLKSIKKDVKRPSELTNIFQLNVKVFIACSVVWATIEIPLHRNKKYYLLQKVVNFLDINNP